MFSRMDRPIRAAMIGTGFIGAVHIDALRRLGVELAGVLGSSRERGRLRANELGVHHSYGSLDELLADDSVDVVHITSPNNQHAAQAHAVIAAGKHVVCEKPLATSSNDARSLLAAGWRWCTARWCWLLAAWCYVLRAAFSELARNRN